MPPTWQWNAQADCKQVELEKFFASHHAPHERHHEHCQPEYKKGNQQDWQEFCFIILKSAATKRLAIADLEVTKPDRVLPATQPKRHA